MTRRRKMVRGAEEQREGKVEKRLNTPFLGERRRVRGCTSCRALFLDLLARGGRFQKKIFLK